LLRSTQPARADPKATFVTLLRVKPTQPLKVSPDGMSGGAAFAIQYAAGGPRAYFAGIIVRGGREDFYVLKSGVVMTFLDSILPW